MRVVGLWAFGAGPTWCLADTVLGQDGPRWVADAATQSRKFENKSNKMRILANSILKLRPAINAVAFSTYTVKISDLKVVSFMSYTHNIQGQCDGTRCWQTTLTISLFNFQFINI